MKLQVAHTIYPLVKSLAPPKLKKNDLLSGEVPFICSSVKIYNLIMSFNSESFSFNELVRI